MSLSPSNSQSLPFGEVVDEESFTPVVNLPSFPGFDVLKELGRGAFGAVYLARQLEPDRLVALKVPDSGVVSWSNLTRLTTEGAVIGRLHHPNIVALHAIDYHAGRPFLVLEFVEGGNLAEHVGTKPLPAKEAAELLLSLARAIDFAHRQGIIHRDLKPANILMSSRIAGTDDSFFPKIADFGLARLRDDVAASRIGEAAGSPSWMSPEQARGSADVSTASDLFSLGSIGYFLLTGRPPFVAANPELTMKQVIEDEPVAPHRLNPSVPRDLETIVLKCLEKSPERRYPGAQELSEDLLRYLEGKPIVARPASPWRKTARWLRRRRRRVSLVGLAVFLGVVLLACGVFYTLHVRKERDRANRLTEECLRTSAQLVESAALGARTLAAAYPDTAEKMLEQASTTYDRLLEQENSSRIRAAKGHMLALFAGIYLDINKSSKAKLAAADAIELFDRNLKEQPGHTESRQNLLQTRVTLGRALLRQGRSAEAENQFVLTLKTLEGVTDAEFRALWTARAGAGLAEIRLAHGDPAAAQTGYERALNTLEEAGVSPALEPDLAEILDHYAKGFEARGDAIEANQYSQRALGLYSKLAREHPEELRYRGRAIEVRLSIPPSMMIEDARKVARENLDLARELAALEPRNAAWKQLVLRCRSAVIDLDRTSNREESAIRQEIALFREKMALADQFMVQDPANVGWPAEVARLKMQEANLLLELARKNIMPREHLEAARITVDSAVNILDDLIQLDRAQVRWRRERITAEQTRGTLQAEGRNMNLAHQAWIGAQDLEIAFQQERKEANADDTEPLRQLVLAYGAKGVSLRALADTGGNAANYIRQAIDAFQQAKNHCLLLRSRVNPKTEWLRDEAEIDRHLRELRK